ncbi:MAG TPA: LysM peptidoglycan-binding domain-containing protein [Candidatus Hydrogenedentes bacterium]|nr:LysM peptidoglycan-binding domain-containing protein [Candidatus Hydrogenedentota bacterium]
MNHRTDLEQGIATREDGQEPSGPDITRIVLEAEEAYRAVRAAEACGDKDLAARQYALLIDLLTEAEVSPSVFVSLKRDFGAFPTRHRLSLYQWLADNAPIPESDKEISIPDPLPERVRVELNAIQYAYSKSFQRALDRSAKYLPHIRAELAKANLPQELAWIVMVESQFTPKIVSRSNAGGMWQFIRDTAVLFNMRMDNYVDERFNWQSSTRAAMEYFTHLHDFFNGNWPLAITAYNMGEFGLDRAVAATGGERHLWTLLETSPASERIRQESKQYYAKFLATLIVVNHPERYGFTIPKDAPENTLRMPISGMYALDDLDKALALSPGTLAQLNPDLLREVTPPSGTYYIAVPASREGAFQTALEKAPRLKYGPRYYKVHRGDTLSTIAQKYGVSTKELSKLNGLRSSRIIRTGQVLRVPPGYYRAGEELLAAEVTASEESQTGAFEYHTVKSGEYPAKIARAHGVPLEEFMEMNGLEKSDIIMPGDSVIVGKKTEASKKASISNRAETSKTTSITHEVASGDTAGAIAAKYTVALKDLLAWNHLNETSVLQIGQKLIIQSAAKPDAMESGKEILASAKKKGAASEPEAESEKETAKPITHKVEKGQTPTSIARKYGVKISDLYVWNNWSKRHLLQIGDTVKIVK